MNLLVFSVPGIRAVVIVLTGDTGVCQPAEVRLTQYRGRGRLTSDFARQNETAYRSQVSRSERAGRGTDSPDNRRRTRHALAIHSDMRARPVRRSMWR